MQVAAAGLKALSPDVLALQEVTLSETLDEAAILAHTIDGHVHYDPIHERRPGESVIGNAVVSRYPIRRTEAISLPSGPEDPRRAMFCALETPAGILPFFNCHLSWEMWQTPRREAQVVALDQFVTAHGGDCPPIVCGDFNASPDSAAILFMTGRMSLAGRGAYYRDSWARRHLHDDGHTWSDRNPHAVRWIERNRRLDYIFVGQLRADGWGAILDCRVVLDMPGSDGAYASDHFGVYAEVGIAVAPEKAV